MILREPLGYRTRVSLLIENGKILIFIASISLVRQIRQFCAPKHRKFCGANQSRLFKIFIKQWFINLQLEVA